MVDPLIKVNGFGLAQKLQFLTVIVTAEDAQNAGRRKIDFGCTRKIRIAHVAFVKGGLGQIKLEDIISAGL